MRHSSRFPTAIHIMLIIAAFQDEYKVNSDLLAESLGVNAVTIRTIFGRLKKAGLILISPGPGGVKLGAPPEGISLYDVYAAVEEISPEALFGSTPVNLDEFVIGRRVTQVVTRRFADTIAVMNRELASTTLRDILDELYGAFPAIYPPWVGK